MYYYCLIWKSNQILLSTAIIAIHNPENGKVERIPTFLDCGIHSSFTTKSLPQLVTKDNPSKRIYVIETGNSFTNKVVESSVAKIQSINSTYQNKLSFYILEELTVMLPKTPVKIKHLGIPKSITLVDPHFDQPVPVEIMIGADIFWGILGCEQLSLGSSNNLKSRSSKFGRIVAGPTISVYSNEPLQSFFGN